MIVSDLMAFFISQLWLIYFGPMLVLDQRRQSRDTLGQFGAGGRIHPHSAQADLRSTRVGVKLQSEDVATKVENNPICFLEPYGQCAAANGDFRSNWNVNNPEAIRFSALGYATGRLEAIDGAAAP